MPATDARRRVRRRGEGHDHARSSWTGSDDGKRGTLIEIGQAVAAASRAESGCRAYRIYKDAEQRNHFVLVEEWDSEEALAAALRRAPHIATFMRAIPDAIVAPRTSRLHAVASTKDLSEVNTA